jgi:hypothetical protein
MKFWEAVEVARKMGKKISFKQGVAEWSSTRNALVWIQDGDVLGFRIKQPADRQVGRVKGRILADEHAVEIPDPERVGQGARRGVDGGFGRQRVLGAGRDL